MCHYYIFEWFLVITILIPVRIDVHLSTEYSFLNENREVELDKTANSL